ncbi:MAG: mannitol dehydrogenase family protein [Clostridiales bacterium]|jgi:fructuronate reductase|nr:mannitol dehydrogenase family protein [Clostridiales bacterium]
MELSLRGIKSSPQWPESGIALPGFDIETVREHTARNPVWIHFGAGNIFRIFPAVLQQRLLERGLAETGIIICEAFDEEIIEKCFEPYDNLTVAVTLKVDGTDMSVVGSITEALAARRSRQRLEQIFAAPSLQMASFTITEKGYAVSDAAGQPLASIKADIEAGPDNAESLMGLVAALCLRRFRAGRLPLALVSMDNCSGNGDKLRDAIMTIVDGWTRENFTDTPPELSLLEVPDPHGSFREYLTNEISFPLTVIDKITPRPSETIRNRLEALGLENAVITRTSRNTYAAPFVNAEESQYLVAEDIFPNGRPPLEQAGVIFTDRATVDKVEKMKVCTCLNPLHTVLAIFGCLLGYTSIADEMKDPALCALIEKIGYTEGLPMVVDPGIIDPRAFIDEVINKRFPNPFVPDTPQRIACDTSQKIPVRFGETLKAYRRSAGWRTHSGPEIPAPIAGLKYIPMFFAGWLRYLMAVDDSGKPFAPSPDPMLAELRGYMSGVKLGAPGPYEGIKHILSNAGIFGVDLYSVGLAGKTEEYFALLNAGPGAVRRVLDNLLKEEA